ncbi:MAG: hypothetical protein AAFS10_05600, partial [Myxococcota bacterium]
EQNTACSDVLSAVEPQGQFCSLGAENPGRVLLGVGEYNEAEKIFAEAFKQDRTQEVNLYIAEALLGKEDCQTAFVALQETADTKPSSAMSPLEVAQRLRTLNQAFQEQCGEQVLVRCVPSDATLSIDGGISKICPAGPIFLASGEHTLVARVNLDAGNNQPAQVLTRQVEVKPGQVNRVDMVLESEEVLGTLGWVGIGGMGLGLLTLTTALIIDATVLSPAIDDFERTRDAGGSAAELNDDQDQIETLQTTNKALLIGGSSMLLIGGGLLLADQLSSGSERTSTNTPATMTDNEGLSLRWGPHGALIQWSATWH